MIGPAVPVQKSLQIPVGQTLSHSTNMNIAPALAMHGMVFDRGPLVPSDQTPYNDVFLCFASRVALGITREKKVSLPLQQVPVYGPGYKHHR